MVLAVCHRVLLAVLSLKGGQLEGRKHTNFGFVSFRFVSRCLDVGLQVAEETHHFFPFPLRAAALGRPPGALPAREE